MATPAVNTPSYVINSAMKNAGLLGEGDEANSEQLAMYLVRLNKMINQWQTRGIKLWLLVDQSVTLVAGQQKYTFKPSGSVNMTKPLKVLQGYYLDSTGANRRPIYPISWDEWNRLSSISQTGQISQYFVDKQQLEIDVSFWLIPDAVAATGTAHLLLQTQVTNAVSLTDEIAFPSEWSLALEWGLSDEICTGQPQAIMLRCEARAKEFRELLEGWDTEDSPVYFQLDPRYGNYGSSNFQ